MEAAATPELTDLRAVLDALQESEGRFRAAFEENPETISIFRPVLDADGRFEDAEILYENRVARARYFGDEPLEALVGRRLFATYPQYRTLLFRTFADFVDRGEVPRDLLHGVRQEGEYWSQTGL